MESSAAVQQSPPPQAVVMQMLMGGWVSKIVSDLTQLNVPDLLKRHGAMSAAELVAGHGIDARPDFLERTLRACASVGVFTEDASGRFGPTELSHVLTSDSPASVKKLAQ